MLLFLGADYHSHISATDIHLFSSWTDRGQAHHRVPLRGALHTRWNGVLRSIRPLQVTRSVHG